MTKFTLIQRSVLFFIILLASPILSRSQVRDTIKIPDILGYKTLKLDPHTHTVFSDGTVWPTIRVEEAWREGLNAVAIADHIEYRPFHNIVVADHNMAYEVAGPLSKKLGITLIHAAEITRSMPPGHINALFLSDCNKLDTNDWKDAVKEAKKQDAFIIWNHPGWDWQQPDTTLWWDEHTWLYENEMLHGIEVVNGNEYYPEAHAWCLEKKLAMIGSTDIHIPTTMVYNFEKGERRPMTLVFAKDQSIESIRDALFNRRTAVFFNNKLVAEEKYLDALFRKSLTQVSVSRERTLFRIKLYNPTSIPLDISKAPGNDPALQFFRNLTIPAEGYSEFIVFTADPQSYKNIELKIIVNNFLVRPGKGLPLKINLIPDGE